MHILALLTSKNKILVTFLPVTLYFNSNEKNAFNLVILANLRCYNSKAGHSICIVSIILFHLVPSYNHTGINGGCNFYSSAIKGAQLWRYYIYYKQFSTIYFVVYVRNNVYKALLLIKIRAITMVSLVQYINKSKLFVLICIDSYC
jgi:hypothetical protein